MLPLRILQESIGNPAEERDCVESSGKLQEKEGKEGGGGVMELGHSG